MRGMLFRSSPEYAYSSHSVSHAAIAEVLHAGAEKCPPGKSATIRRDHYLLHLVLSGRGDLRTGGKSYRLSSHDCFLLRPGQEHVYRADAEHPWEYVWPGFSGVDDEILGELYGVLALGCIGERRGNSGSPPDYVEEAVAYIEARYATLAGAGAVARYVGLDRSYFSRLFQERSGVSVSQFRLRPPDRTGAGQDPFAD